MQTRGRNNNQNEILSGWKEIARYLGRGVRTVQRYENELGLPTRRIANNVSSVIATKSDLDSWVNSRPTMQSSDAERLYAELMTLRKELKENIRKIRENVLKLRRELRDVRERQDAVAEAVAQYSKIGHGPQGVAKGAKAQLRLLKPDGMRRPVSGRDAEYAPKLSTCSRHR